MSNFAFTPYDEVKAILNEVLTGAQVILGDNFVGMYLDGSLAAGDFAYETSDHIRKLKDFSVGIFQILVNYSQDELPYPPLITNKMTRSEYGNPSRDSRPRRNQRQTD